MGSSWVPAAAMLAAQIVLSFTSIVAAVLAPLAAPDLGVDPELIGIYTAVVSASSAVSSLLSGAFIRRFGPLRIVQTSLALSALGLAVAVTGSLAAVLLAGVILGLGYGPMTPSSSQILQRTTPPERVNLVFSVKQTGVPGGVFLGGAVMPAAATVAGWRPSLLWLAAVALVFVAALQPLRTGFDAHRDPQHALFRTAYVAALLRRTVADKALWEITAISMVYNGMQNALSTFLVVYLHGRAGMSLVTAGALLSLSQAAGAIGRVLWGVVADRLGRPRLVLAGLGLGMTVCATLLGLVGASAPFAAVIVVCIAFGGSATGWNGVYLAQVARLAPPGQAGEITGASNFFGSIGSMLVPTLFSTIVALSDSYAAAYGVVAAGTLVCALVLLRPQRSEVPPL
jgi:predicted MFS family arabinose efflux permease